MNIVGQLAETVFVTVKELYRGLNPATLTGGIDVIVVQQPDGSFQCSPFHVRFGKLGVLRSKEKIVDIEINGEPVDLHMKLGDNGEAFFVEENQNMEVPAYLCTSPIPLELPEEVEEAAEGTPVIGVGARKKKRRRKRVRSENHPREEASTSSEEREADPQDSPASEEMSTPLQLSKSIYYSLSEEPGEDLGAAQTREADQHPELSPSGSVFCSQPASPGSDCDLLESQDSPGLQMQWNWGGFPTLCQPEITPAEVSCSHFRTIERQDSFDLDSEPAICCGTADSVNVVKPEPRMSAAASAASSPQRNPHVSHSTSKELFMSCVTSVDADSADIPECTQNTEQQHQVTEITDCCSTGGTETAECGKDDETKAKKHLTKESKGCVVQETSEPQMEVLLSEESNGGAEEQGGGIDPCAGGGEASSSRPMDEPLTDRSAPKADSKDGRVSFTTVRKTPPSETGSREEQQDRRKGKRNHHLGPTDIYLDDLTSLDPEVAARYFPKSDAETACLQGAEPSSCSGSQTPQSVGSGAMDSGTEYLSDSASYTMDVSMSLCGRVGDTSQITKEKFKEHLVTYQDFVGNPGIIEDPSLVICVNSNYYNWAVAAPMILSMTAFQKNLPKSSIDRLVKDKMPKKSGRWWFSWRRREMADSQQKGSKEEQEEPLAGGASSTVRATLDDADSDEAAGLGRKATLPSSLSSDTLTATQSVSQVYRKSLRLTSQQIEHLNLREGANKVVFSVTTQYQGTCRCEAAIYLWKWDDRVIISDIDGTITKSDALGHILPQFGKDWTHKGIAKLYHKIHQNGYKFLYCSARAIGMAAITKDYLQWVNDKGTVLPKGPVLLAPSSLFSALHREVIEKKPEVFKVACLNDIRDLFNPGRQPFYAAFGNRTNDAYAYKKVGVPETRIFTVNPKGELTQEMTKGNKSSYSHLSELVEHFFPALSACSSTSSVLDCPEFSSFSYWKEPLPQLELDALL
ncbi:phosphatidate phosphatase LPIN2 isoform X1 [Oryzias melastigma]|uniref:phosphatidate phosphatase n=1 Tax=Oryzias melastigma TaxID=30732 RepID=A0A3B3DP85_ORYME|nr:phosphatidate phosphatase LPIN2 isoform X1 [Oryzias melastigma]